MSPWAEHSATKSNGRHAKVVLHKTDSLGIPVSGRGGSGSLTEGVKAISGRSMFCFSSVAPQFQNQRPSLWQFQGDLLLGIGAMSGDHVPRGHSASCLCLPPRGCGEPPASGAPTYYHTAAPPGELWKGSRGCLQANQVERPEPGII